MGMYTQLDLTMTFKEEDFGPLKEHIDYGTEDSNNPALHTFLQDVRHDMLSMSYTYQQPYYNLTVKGDIKNYTDTYEKLYEALESLNPTTGYIEELYEEWDTPNIYYVQDGKMILSKQHTWEQ